MSALQKISLGTPPTAVDGDTSRAANIKMNANVDVLSSQVALTNAGAPITAAQALTAAHIGKRVNIALTAAGVINMPAASTCQADQVTLLRNTGTTVVTLAITSGSGDSVALSKLNPGESALMDTDGVHAWTVLTRGRTNSDNETVGGTLGVSGLATLAGGASFGASGQASISSAGAYSGVGAAYSGNVTVGGTLGVTGAATFTARPSFAGKTPWDSGNFTPGNYAPISSPTFGVQISTPWIITTGPAAPASQGTYVSWNDASGGGQTFITCNPGVGGGGLILRTVNSTGSAELGRLAISATGALTVTGTTAMSFGAYGYISQGGAGTSPSVSNAPVSLYAPNGRVVAIEVDAISDRRLKTDVAPIDGSRALDFVRSVGSYSFVWKSDPDGKRRFGYMAQDLGKLGFHELLGQAEDAGLEETVDADGFVSPANHRFTVSYDQVVPIHSSVLRQLLERIEALEAKCQ